MRTLAIENISERGPVFVGPRTLLRKRFCKRCDRLEFIGYRAWIEECTLGQLGFDADKGVWVKKGGYNETGRFAPFPGLP